VNARELFTGGGRLCIPLNAMDCLNHENSRRAGSELEAKKLEGRLRSKGKERETTEERKRESGLIQVNNSEGCAVQVKIPP